MLTYYLILKNVWFPIDHLRLYRAPDSKCFPWIDVNSASLQRTLKSGSIIYISTGLISNLTLPVKIKRRESVDPKSRVNTKFLSTSRRKGYVVTRLEVTVKTLDKEVCKRFTLHHSFDGSCGCDLTTKRVKGLTTDPP